MKILGFCRRKVIKLVKCQFVLVEKEIIGTEIAPIGKVVQGIITRKRTFLNIPKTRNGCSLGGQV